MIAILHLIKSGRDMKYLGFNFKFYKKFIPVYKFMNTSFNIVVGLYPIQDLSKCLMRTSPICIGRKFI